MQKVVIAPDSYKESLSAKEISLTIAKAFRMVFPDIETICIPLADGGEGTAEALKDALGGIWCETEVKNPLHLPHKAAYAYIPNKKLAIIEMAAASGLPLISKEQRNPLITDSYGTGQLIAHGLDQGAKEFIIGLGGSATNDGGAGMMRALGMEFLDTHGQPIDFGGAALSKLARIRTTNLDPRLKQAQFHIACDVNNPLFGLQGASHIFGPQKGATPEMVLQLDQALKHYASIITSQGGKDIASIAGSGAAGGMGAAFYAFFDNAELKAGIDIVTDAVELKKHIQDADLVITGEGRMDYQTQFGKTPMGAQKIAASCNVPIIAIAGSLGKNYNELLDKGFLALFDTTVSPCSLDEALKHTEHNLFQTAISIARIFHLHQKI